MNTSYWQIVTVIILFRHTVVLTYCSKSKTNNWHRQVLIIAIEDFTYRIALYSHNFIIKGTNMIFVKFNI